MKIYKCLEMAQRETKWEIPEGKRPSSTKNFKLQLFKISYFDHL